ncbi:MAG: zinc ribbon domain-containing protein [Planctomycetota bacterium]|jgi:putative FmdB family regulatory protein|nr:zinc ribbon domain-containing protein [Planctomycetota bacterium]
MPTYDYVCKFCEHAFEHFQGIHDAHLKKCPECSRRGLERQFGTGAGIVFKGSGFYETDYKQKDKPSKKETSGSGDARKNSSGDKPAGKAADKPSGVDKKPSSPKSDD